MSESGVQECMEQEETMDFNFKLLRRHPQNVDTILCIYIHVIRNKNNCYDTSRTYIIRNKNNYYDRISVSTVVLSM